MGADIERVKALLAEGLSRPQIANRLHVSFRTIHYWCAKAGIPRRAAGRPPRDDSHALANLVDRLRDNSQRCGLYFRSAKGRYLFYDGRPIAAFDNPQSAWAWLRNPVRRGASIQLHVLQRERVVAAVAPAGPLNVAMAFAPRLAGLHAPLHG